MFRIYSMTKPFTAVATMMLVEDGVLQLGDPVSKWLPAFKDVKVSTPQGDVRGRADDDRARLCSATPPACRTASSPSTRP